MSNRYFYFLSLSLMLLLYSCKPKEKEFNEEDKVLHAAPAPVGISSLSFSLYKDGRYRISNAGGIGEYIFTGNYLVNRDTVTFNNLDSESSLKYNRLLILRYNKQDSSYWKSKYLNNPWKWQDLRKQDSAMGGSGDIYQLNEKNQIARYETHFIIRLDSLLK
jgi:hypothetical protein